MITGITVFIQGMNAEMIADKLSNALFHTDDESQLSMIVESREKSSSKATFPETKSCYE